MTRPILVTGADGQLGRDLLAVAATRNVAAVGVGRAELDVTDPVQAKTIVDALDPAAIVHCAAWTDVDGAEDQPDSAWRVNVVGTSNMVSAARDRAIRIVAMSTDYVFGGDSPNGYGEGDTPAPINEYGRSKHAAEQEVLSYSGGLVARTSWLFGEHGENFCRTIDRLSRERDAIEVVTDQIGCPTWTRDLAGAVLECLDSGLSGVVHLVGEPAATWHDLACAVVAANGSGCAVQPTSSDRFPRPARRPQNSILRPDRSGVPPVGPWRVGVGRVVAAWAAGES